MEKSRWALIVEEPWSLGEVSSQQDSRATCKPMSYSRQHGTEGIGLEKFFSTWSLGLVSQNRVEKMERAPRRARKEKCGAVGPAWMPGVCLLSEKLL